MPIKEVVVYGGGGFAAELAWLIESCNVDAKIYHVVCFVDDDPSLQLTTLNGVPILSFDDAVGRFPNAAIVAGIGSPQNRERAMKKAAAAGFGFESIIHPRVERSKWIQFGESVVICAGTVLTTNITIGDHVQINLNCTIGHNAILEDFTTLAPGVHVSGWVHLGKRVYVGTGAVFINGTRNNPIKVGDDAIIGAGACVTKSVPSGITAVGVPARPL